MTLQSRPADWRRALVAAVFLAILGLGLAAAFRSFVTPSKADDDDETESSVQSPSRVTITDGVVTLTLDAATRRNGGIEAATPAAPPARNSVVGYGTILDATRLTNLNNQYLNAKAQLATSQAKLGVSRGVYERTKTLYDEHQDSAAQLQSAEGNFRVDQASLAAAEASLANVTASAQQSWGSVLGQALLDGAPLIKRLIERRTYLVKITLSPGTDLATPPRTASAVFNGATRIKLTFVSLATATDPAIQGLSYFYDTPAENRVLPGVNVLASLATADPVNGVVVPQAAVVWLHGKAWVYLRTSKDTFIRRHIVANQPGPDGGYIVTGVPAGAHIVVAGAQMLLSEEFRAQSASAGDSD